MEFQPTSIPGGKSLEDTPGPLGFQGVSLGGPTKLSPKQVDLLRAQLTSFSHSRSFKGHSYDEGEVLQNFFRDMPNSLHVREASQHPARKAFIEKWRAPYLEYLRSPEGRAEVLRLHSLTQRCREDFAPQVAVFVAEQRAGVLPSNIEGYLGQGLSATGFAFEHQGQPLVARIAHHDEIPDIRRYADSAGITGTPKLVALSFSPYVEVLSRVPGKAISQFTAQDKPLFSESEVQGAIETVLALGRRGLCLDPKPDNFLYSRESGVGIIDFQRTDLTIPPALSLNYLWGALSYVSDADILLKYRDKSERLNPAGKSGSWIKLTPRNLENEGSRYCRDEDPEYLQENASRTLLQGVHRSDALLKFASVLKREYPELLYPFLEKSQVELCTLLQACRRHEHWPSTKGAFREVRKIVGTLADVVGEAKCAGLLRVIE